MKGAADRAGKAQVQKKVAFIVDNDLLAVESDDGLDNVKPVNEKLKAANARDTVFEAKRANNSVDASNKQFRLPKDGLDQVEED